MSNLPKLVRDKIPEILASSGIRHDVEVLSTEEYIKALDTKLLEEVNEYYESHESEYPDYLEELADIYEVIMALATALGYKATDLRSRASKKRSERGAFDSRILLKKIYESDKCEEVD